jgi:hypothetical protein
MSKALPAARDVPCADRAAQLLGRFDAVLQRNDECVGAEEWSQRWNRFVELPRLDAEQHHVDRADVGGIGARHRVDVHVPEHAIDAQAVGANGSEVRSARDHGQVGARLGQACAEIRADAAGPEYRYTHLASRADANTFMRLL